MSKLKKLLRKRWDIVSAVVCEIASIFFLLQAAFTNHLITFLVGLVFFGLAFLFSIID
jgi:hypothetical protein